jgi:hypothetical protein
MRYKCLAVLRRPPVNKSRTVPEAIENGSFDVNDTLTFHLKRLERLRFLQIEKREA